MKNIVLILALSILFILNTNTQGNVFITKKLLIKGTIVDQALKEIEDLIVEVDSAELFVKIFSEKWYRTYYIFADTVEIYLDPEILKGYIYIRYHSVSNNLPLPLIFTFIFPASGYYELSQILKSEFEEMREHIVFKEYEVVNGF